MIVFPAIDVLGGRVVRLKQGAYDAVTVYGDDPVEQARAWRDAGASWLHVVDLDGARDGVPANADVIGRIAEATGLLVEVGGGVRDLAALERVLDSGATRAVLGSVLVKDPEFARAAAERYGDRVVAGVDARDGMVAVEGWREGTATPALELVGELSDAGFRHVVYTDISRDGMQTGISAAVYEEVARSAGFPVVASGGVSALRDLRALGALGDDVIEGVIVGRALYEGAFTLEEALAVAREPKAGTASPSATPLPEEREVGA